MTADEYTKGEDAYMLDFFDYRGCDEIAADISFRHAALEQRGELPSGQYAVVTAGDVADRLRWLRDHPRTEDSVSAPSEAQLQAMTKMLTDARVDIKTNAIIY